MFFFWILSSCLFHSNAEDLKAANARLQETNLALRTLLKQLTSQELAIGVEDPCEGIPNGWGIGTSSYWNGQFKKAGLTDTQIGKVCVAESKYYYNSVDTCVAQGSYSGVCDSSKVVCAGGENKNGYGNQQAAAVKAAINNGGVHANCRNDPCEGIEDGWDIGTSGYWYTQFKNAGLADTQIGRICVAGSKYYYNSVDTCVGKGSHSEVCDSSKAVCGGGGNKYGYGSQQASAVKAAINDGGVHPSCPPPPQGVCREFSGCLHYSLIRDATCSGGQDTCDSSCCDPLPYRILNGDCRSGIYDRDQQIEKADTIRIDGRDCWQACNNDPTCFGFDLPTTTSFDWCRMYTVNELRSNGDSILIDTNTQCYIKKETPGQWGDYSSYEPLLEGDARCEDSRRTSYIRLEADDPIKQIEDPVRCARSCVANEECVMFQIKSNRRDGWTQCLLLRDYVCKNQQGTLSFDSYVPKN